ncbi:hypothetical protein ACTHSQ_11290, partial [Neisseria sp. P0009.S008]|uniref:hypothetical protein n=1 Tax=Neisseria sp. P0009.S008 TaxID=3436715 RepID=UPI003F81E7C2
HKEQATKQGVFIRYMFACWDTDLPRFVYSVVQYALSDDVWTFEGIKRMNLLGALARVGSLTMLSRILGFLRDAVIARTFGASMATDAFF